MAGTNLAISWGASERNVRVAEEPVGEATPRLRIELRLIGDALVREITQMALINSLLAAVRHDEEGQGLAEYALILALIAIVAIVALLFLGGQISGILNTVGNSV